MAILIFIIILAILIFVHELGHFLFAKKLGIRVDEFAIGFPPRLFSKKKGETNYSLNLIPFGGYVKIFGESPDKDSLSGPDSARSMVNKPRWIQALVLVAGVLFNLVFAWILISIGFMVGLPTSQDSVPRGETLRDPILAVVVVSPDSPAEEAGLQLGDEIIEVSLVQDETITAEMTSEGISNFVTEYGTEELAFSYQRKDEVGTVTILPREGILENQPAIGIATDRLGIVRLPVHKAIWHGLTTAGHLTVSTVVAFGELIGDAFKGQGDIKSLTGPVGLVGVVGDTTVLGFVYLLLLTAFISINLAVINLIPFPALDGGRILFLLIEKIKGSRIKPSVANWLNTFGFILLIGLMLIVTFNDILVLVK